MQKCKAELYWSKRTTTKACSGVIVFGNRGKTLSFFPETSGEKEVHSKIEGG